MPTELHVRPHAVTPGKVTVEIWYNGSMIGTVNGCEDGPGVRVVTKYELHTTRRREGQPGGLDCIETRFTL